MHNAPLVCTCVIQYQRTVVMWRLTGSLKRRIGSDLSSSWLVKHCKFHSFPRARSRAPWETRVCLSTGEPPLCDCLEGLRLFTLLKPDNRTITWVLWTYFVVQASILRLASLSEGQRLMSPWAFWATSRGESLQAAHGCILRSHPGRLNILGIRHRKAAVASAYSTV